jgi:hypothetical protein
MTPLIPYEFDPPAAEWEEHHLDYKDTTGGKLVTWPVVGASLFLPEGPAPGLDEIKASNSGKFRHYGISGFSIGDYHEFLLIMPGERFICFKMGRIEATFGQATPLAAMIFYPYHREKWFGPWETIVSLRIIGAGADEAELAFINSCTEYEARYGVLPELLSLDEDKLWWGNTEDEDHTEQVVTIPPMVTNLEPLRFFHDGLLQVDAIAACIYFYRTLEYFSFFTNASEMSRLRHDPTLSDEDFSKRVLDLVSRDEKGPIFRLITTLVDDEILAAAVTDKLITSPTKSLLCEAVYAFRNSIVHGKFSYGYSLRSGSVLDEDLQIASWKSLLRNLARRALFQYGSKRI